MNSPEENHRRLLLHACCGPCSLEPSRLLAEEGEIFDIYYANSNIFPKEEYDLRLETLSNWSKDEGISTIEGTYDHAVWERECKEPFENDEISRKERCRRCYRLRFEESADYAARNGYDALCTTLSVSPYQYTDIIREELEAACHEASIDCVFKDFRPYYDAATARSREANMYRQNYCGCEISATEAEKEREQRRVERKLEQDKKRAEKAETRAAEMAELERRKEERRRYDEERARRRKILKSLREERSRDDPSNSAL